MQILLFSDIGLMVHIDSARPSDKCHNVCISLCLPGLKRGKAVPV